MMVEAHSVAQVRAQVAAWRAAGQRIALVPTMGNLHRGHLELVRQAQLHADQVVASVFVNPLQFAAGEDFSRYPRTLEQDRLALEQARCDLLFAPNAQEIYPRGMEGLTQVAVLRVSGILCGKFRPGHFEGVATVVNILFNLVQPDVALFGEKDYQQLYVIRRMVADLRLPIAIVGVATAREADGLALSSRNQYLSADERARAATLYTALTVVASQLKAGRRDFAALTQRANTQLQAAGFTPQYVEVQSPDLQPPQADARHFLVIAAAYLGRTRLIDNLLVKIS